MNFFYAVNIMFQQQEYMKHCSINDMQQVFLQPQTAILFCLFKSNTLIQKVFIFCCQCPLRYRLSLYTTINKLQVIDTI